MNEFIGIYREPEKRKVVIPKYDGGNVVCKTVI